LFQDHTKTKTLSLLHLHSIVEITILDSKDHVFAPARRPPPSTTRPIKILHKRPNKQQISLEIVNDFGPYLLSFWTSKALYLASTNPILPSLWSYLCLSLLWSVTTWRSLCS